MNIKLNLIPTGKRKEIEKNTRFNLIIRTEICVSAVALCFLAVIFCFRFILNMNYASNLKEQEKNNREEQYVKIHAFDEQFSKINSQVAAISAVEKNQLYWSDLFSRLNGTIFPGIELNIIETKDYNVTLFGLANSRDDLILFKEKLENSDCLFNINLPLSELVERNNVEFQMDLEIKPECLKKKQ